MNSILKSRPIRKFDLCNYFFRENFNTLLPLAIAAIVLSSTQWGLAQQDLPFDVFGEAIDNRQVYMHIEKNAEKTVAQQESNAVERLTKQLKSAEISCDLQLDSLVCTRPSGQEDLYEHMVKSSVYISQLYNCGRCDRTHAGFSGGVVVSEEGLVLTNHHVLNKLKDDNTEGFMAMTCDGKCWEIEEVIAANAKADIALIRLKSDGHKFHAAPIAVDRPTPMDPVRIISHPFGEFYVMTEGEVSRYSKGKLMPTKRRDAEQATWMEVTADFAMGSSGSAVFNAQGEVVGLVSRVQPLVDSDEKRKKSDPKNPIEGFVVMILKRCVPLSAVHGCFQTK